ncbi:MAG: hypothetical protein JJE40_02430 [Vicinamibacteria bacterium]|nr:hypothetical protein [Vicinamibacteria bacterium]
MMLGAGNPPSLWRITSAGENPTRIDIDLPSIRAFRLHPDGKQLVFDAGTATYEVWKMEQQ